MNTEGKYTKHLFKRISLEIGNICDGFQFVEIKNEKNKLRIEYTPIKNRTGVLFSLIMNVDYEIFFNELLNINIENWENNYSNKVYSGHEWKLELYFRPSIVIKKQGSNNFPNNFIEIINLIKTYYHEFNVDIKTRTKLDENDLLKLYCAYHQGTSFSEVSVGEMNIYKDSNDRRIDIVRIENDIYKWKMSYSKNKEHFNKIVRNKSYKIELVEIKTKLNRGVIGQIIVGEYLFKKKYNVHVNISKAILYHIGDELLELFCKDNQINLIKY